MQGAKKTTEISLNKIQFKIVKAYYFAHDAGSLVVSTFNSLNNKGNDEGGGGDVGINGGGSVWIIFIWIWLPPIITIKWNKVTNEKDLKQPKLLITMYVCVNGRTLHENVFLFAFILLKYISDKFPNVFKNILRINHVNKTKQ